jgi:hypothetical protein
LVKLIGKKQIKLNYDLTSKKEREPSKEEKIDTNSFLITNMYFPV